MLRTQLSGAKWPGSHVGGQDAGFEGKVHNGVRIEGTRKCNYKNLTGAHLQKTSGGAAKKTVMAVK